jgi:hypothetical protein
MKWYKKIHFVEYFKNNVNGIMFSRELSKRALDVFLKTNKNKITIINSGKYY